MRRLLLVPVIVALTMSVLQADIRRSQTPAAPQSDAGFPAIGGAPIVKLISNGAEPRKAVRYTVPAGSTSRTEVITEMDMLTEVMGQSMPMKPPTIKMVTEVAVSAVAPNGDMTFTSSIPSMTFDTAGADPTIAAAMTGAPSDLSGIKTTGTMTNRGLTSAQMDLSKITDQNLKQTMETAGSVLQAMSFPVPEEAVGVGARWEVRQRTVSAGVDTLSTQVVELVKIEGTKLTLKIGTEQTALPQPVKLPGLPPEVEANLVKLTGTGTTTAVLDLATFANTSEGTSSVAMQMLLRMMGTEQNVTSTVGMKIKTTPVK